MLPAVAPSDERRAMNWTSEPAGKLPDADAQFRQPLGYENFSERLGSTSSQPGADAGAERRLTIPVPRERGAPCPALPLLFG